MARPPVSPWLRVLKKLEAPHRELLEKLSDLPLDLRSKSLEFIPEAERAKLLETPWFWTGKISKNVEVTRRMVKAHRFTGVRVPRNVYSRAYPRTTIPLSAITPTLKPHVFHPRNGSGIIQVHKLIYIHLCGPIPPHQQLRFEGQHLDRYDLNPTHWKIFKPNSLENILADENADFEASEAMPEAPTEPGQLITLEDGTQQLSETEFDDLIECMEMDCDKYGNFKSFANFKDRMDDFFDDVPENEINRLWEVSGNKRRLDNFEKPFLEPSSSPVSEIAVGIAETS